MRFPWLQLDMDFVAAKAKDLGAHLGISRREALGLAVDLWAWALARARDDAPPDGFVTGTGPVPDRLLSGAVEWTGPAEALTAGLLAVGLMVRVDDGYRLTGFERYKATWEKNRRRSGGKPEGNRTGAPPAPTRKTQTQTQTQTQREEKIPPTPQGARELREGDPCEEHNPPQTAPAAAQVALESFAPEPPKPKPGEWTIPDAVDAVHRVVYDGKPYGWVESLDGPAALVLKGYCDAEGVPPECQAEEIGRRLGRAMCRFHQQFAPGVGKSQTLKRLANRDCWRANADPPTREEPGRDKLTGVAQTVVRVLEPWAQVYHSRRAA